MFLVEIPVLPLPDLPIFYCPTTSLLDSAQIIDHQTITMLSSQYLRPATAVSKSQPISARPCSAYLERNRPIRLLVWCPAAGPPSTHRLYSDHKPLLRPINAPAVPAPGAAHSNLARLARSRRTLLPALIHCKRYRKAMRPVRNSATIVYILRHVTKLRWAEIWHVSARLVGSSPMGLITIQSAERSAETGDRGRRGDTAETLPDARR